MLSLHCINYDAITDDGYTGTNFNRPDFKRMIEDCDLGYVSTIIVKDMSRLGREYLQVGYYTETFFPSANIRFIAINDGVDSDNDENEFLPITNIINEMYARDTSRKVRSAHRIRGNMGEPLSQPPYGYEKSPENKKKWVVDYEAAQVVKRIFAMRLEGKGDETISRILQESGVLTPIAYSRAKGVSKPGKSTPTNPCKWCKTTVSKILATQEYCGDIINFKTYSKSFKNKKRLPNPEENRVVFRDVHEPIIDRATFESVQELVGKTKRRQPKHEEYDRSIFSDLLYCGDCGSKMWYHVRHNKTDQFLFSCSNYVGERGTCPDMHYIRADSLEIVIKNELKRLTSYLKDDEEEFAGLIRDKVHEDYRTQRKRLEKELQSSTARFEEVARLYEKVYEDNASGKVSDEWFMQLSQKYEDERIALKKKRAFLTEELRKADDAEDDKEKFITAVRRFNDMEILTASMLRELIEKIEVFPIQGTGKNRTQRIVVHYRFVGCLTVPTKSDDTYTADTRKGVAVKYIPLDEPEKPGKTA